VIERAVSRVVDLTDPARSGPTNMTFEEARRLLAGADPAAVRGFAGSFALVAERGEVVRLVRSLDRPLRYFLAKREDGPLLVVADRIDRIRKHLASLGFADQFHPSYTRMVPAHHVVEIHLVGCPDPLPAYRRFFDPPRGILPADPDEIGRRYVGALAEEIRRWILRIDPAEPIGVAFSGGVDSGAVLLVLEHVMRSLGMSPARLKAFTLAAPGGADLAQARRFLEAVGRSFYLEEIAVPPEAIDWREAVRVVEDYKPLDVESAAMALALCRALRERYPEWKHLADGDGGDENLKDYPIEANPELTIRSVLSNPMLYQEGWGVASVKHSLTYSGGQSRSCARTYAPLARYGFEGFSPFTRPALIEVAEAIPFAELTGGNVERLYSLKGDIVSRGVAALTGVAFPVFPKRRFQHGVFPEGSVPEPRPESAYRREFLARYAETSGVRARP
jgi:asparagine synthase (glutamine-hydrolysing)